MENILAMDISAQTGFLIDPVAFAYDFGARIYDARVGRWLSVDPLVDKYPSMSLYMIFLNPYHGNLYNITQFRKVC